MTGSDDTTADGALARTDRRQLLKRAGVAAGAAGATALVGVVTASPAVAADQAFGLTDLNDVTLTSPVTGALLVKTSGDWVNSGDSARPTIMDANGHLGVLGNSGAGLANAGIYIGTGTDLVPDHTPGAAAPMGLKVRLDTVAGLTAQDGMHVTLNLVENTVASKARGFITEIAVNDTVADPGQPDDMATVANWSIVYVQSASNRKVWAGNDNVWVDPPTGPGGLPRGITYTNIVTGREIGLFNNSLTDVQGGGLSVVVQGTKGFDYGIWVRGDKANTGGTLKSSIFLSSNPGEAPTTWSIYYGKRGVGTSLPDPAQPGPLFGVSPAGDLKMFSASDTLVVGNNNAITPYGVFFGATGDAAISHTSTGVLTVTGHLALADGTSGNHAATVEQVPPGVPMGSGKYCEPPHTARTTFTMSLNTLYTIPLFFPVATSLAAVGAEITTGGTAGSVLRFGLYSGSAGSPVTALFRSSAGIAATAVGACVDTTVAGTTVGPGWVWLAVVAQTAAPGARTGTLTTPIPLSTLGGTNTVCTLAQGSITGTLPSPFTGTATSATAPLVFVKLT